MNLFILVFITIFFSLVPCTQAQRLVADLSSKEVAITTGFTGAELLLFGVTEGYGDVVVTVIGPKRDEIVRRKQRVAGVWVNGKSVLFEKAPVYYWMAASKPLNEIATSDVLARLQLGVERIKLFSTSVLSPEDLNNFREALVRNKRRLQLYSPDISEIKLVRNLLFRSTIPFPANVPVGEYLATVYLFKNGIPVGKHTTPITVRKVGLEARIFNFAHDHAAWYGLIAIMIALVAGWVAGIVFRRA